jgi:serine protease Do
MTLYQFSKTTGQASNRKAWLGALNATWVVKPWDCALRLVSRNALACDSQFGIRACFLTLSVLVAVLISRSECLGQESRSAESLSSSVSSGAVLKSTSTDQDKPLAAAARGHAELLSMAFQQAAAKMMPSVVTVLSKRKDVDETLENLDLLDDNSAEDFELGSGVILSADGLCVTNNHVVKNGKSIRVRLADGRTLMGKDLKSDAKSDVAIFQIVSDEPLPAATIGDSARLGIGDWVLAIGSPFSLDQTVSAGIISSKGRSMGKLLQGQLLQTDATINPGNSGGALLDLKGELVGINTAISTTTGQFQGVGFAIPIHRVEWIAKELATNGQVRRSIFGMRAEAIPQDTAKLLKISVRSGVQVGRVNPDSPALRAGLETGDIILTIGDQKVATPDDFRSLVEQLPADRSYILQVIRDGKSMKIEITPNVVSQ